MSYDLTEDEIIGQIIDGSITELTNTAATSIADNILGACTNLTSITFENAASVGESAFSSCTALTEVNMPNCVSAGENCFYLCSALAAISLPKLKRLMGYTFDSCQALNSLSLPVCEVVEERGLYSSSALTEVNLPACTEVKDWGFHNVGDLVTTINLPLCETIGAYAFYSCRATSISLPKCKSIGIWAFYICNSLVAVDLPVCESVGEYAFQGMQTLVSVSIPACKTIAASAFTNCYKLETVTITAAESIGISAFQACTALKQIFLPKCKMLSQSAFQGCSSLQSADLPICESLGNMCFLSCSSLTSISIPKAQTVGSGTFVYCSALPVVNFSSDVVSIDSSAFYGNTALADIYIDKFEDSVSGSPWGATTATIHWREVPSLAIASISIGLQQKTLTDTITLITADRPTIYQNINITILGQTLNLYVDSFTHNKSTGLYSCKCNYLYAKKLDEEYTYERTVSTVAVGGALDSVIGSLDNVSEVQRYMGGWDVTGFTAKSGNKWKACDIRSSLISTLIGWTDIVPTNTCNLLYRSGNIIMVVQRGEEPNSVTITDGELEDSTYGTSGRLMKLLTSSSNTYYIVGDTNTGASDSVVTTDPTTYLSGQYTDNSGQQTLNYSYGLLTSEEFQSTDQALVGSTTYTYSKIYPPANLLSKTMTRTETKDTSDVPQPGDITSFPYKVTETVVNTSSVTNSMAINGKDLIQSNEDTTCTKSGYNITDAEGTHEPWEETEEHSTKTYYSDMGQGQWSVTTYKDDAITGSQIVTGNPGAQASAYSIRMNSTYASTRGGKKTANKAELSGRFNGNTRINVADQSTLNSIASKIGDLNGKTEEKLSVVYIGNTYIDFSYKVTLDGNDYYVDNNNISVTPKNGVRQTLTLVRWY